MPPVDNKSSRRPPKRKADSGAEPAERKRAQNRISQQCLREKNAAYVRNLENAVELLQNTITDNDGGGRRDRYETLVDAHLKLLKENQRLEEALFRLRKKLLSLSNAAASAADDTIFGSILGRQDGSQDQSARTTSRECQETPRSRLESQDREQGQQTETHLDESAGTFFSAQDLGDRDVGTLNSATISYDNTLQDSPAGYDFSTDIYESGDFCSGSDVLGTGVVSLSSLLIPTSPNPTATALKTIAVTSVNQFGSKILNACRRCMKQASKPSIPTSRTTIVPEQFNKKLITAATGFIARCLGLENYIYGVNGARYIEKVLSWRLGLEARDCVPSPFRPTPLQAKQLHDYWSIDLINWPDIRDQIMLEQNQCDYDALIKDTILHSVIEQPHLGVAVGVMDIFQNQIQRRDKKRGSQATSTRSYLNDPSWTFFELGPEAQTLYLTAADPVEEALVSELERRMRDDAPVGCHSQDAIASPAAAIRGGNEVALFFGLDDMVGWKLSKEFATKYPFLDCSTAVSACEVASSAAVFGW